MNLKKKNRPSYQKTPDAWAEPELNELAAALILLTSGNLLNRPLEIMSMAQDKIEPPWFY